MPRSLDDGRAPTSDFGRWLGSWRQDQSRLRLVYDPSPAFWSATYADAADTLEPLVDTTVEAIYQGGHTIFTTGVLPIRGPIFGRDRSAFRKLEEDAPEVADLFRLLSLAGDYRDDPFPFQEYWTGELDPNGLTIAEAVDRTTERRDFALSDILLACWAAYCTLFHQLPLPDVIGLANRITALPIDHRTSTYAVLGALKREAIDNRRLRRELEGLLSWLPVIDIAPPDDFESYLQDLFTPQLWQTVQKEEKQSLRSAEEGFVRIRRLSRDDREHEPLHGLTVDWSRVAERFLLRALNDRRIRSTSAQPLGQLIPEVRSLAHQSSPKKYRLLSALDFLSELNDINKNAGKHLTGAALNWEQVVHLHAGVYWALKAVLEEANKA